MLTVLPRSILCYISYIIARLESVKAAKPLLIRIKQQHVVALPVSAYFITFIRLGGVEVEDE